MSWADLDKLAAGKPTADGGATLVIKDERSFTQLAEARLVSVLVAVARVARARAVLAERHAGKGRIVYLTTTAPPSWLLEAVTAAGGVIFDGARTHALDRPPEATLVLDAAFCDLAIAVRRRANVRTFAEALDVVEYERRTRPIAPADLAAWRTAQLELMALAGELARADRPGRWIVAPAHRMPLAIDLGKGSVMAPGARAETVLAGGGSLRGLVEVAHGATPEALAAAARTQAAGPRAGVDVALSAQLAPRLVPRAALAAELAFDLLVPDEVDHPDLPVIAYATSDPADAAPAWIPSSPALRQRALANLDQRLFPLAARELAGRAAIEITGHPDATEALLHRRTMQQIAQQLGAQQLLVGVPARGQLVAIAAPEDHETGDGRDLAHAFLLHVEQRYLAAPEAARITAEVIVYQGAPVDRVRSSAMDTRRALRRMGIDPDA